jgi:hypothetical protein
MGWEAGKLGGYEAKGLANNLAFQPYSFQAYLLFLNRVL